MHDTKVKFPIELPRTKASIYLDTCVWGMLSQSEEATSGLIDFCSSQKPALAISSFTLFELSRAPQLFENIDSLLYELRHHVYIASINDVVIESELQRFPKTWKMKWLPLFFVRDFMGPSFIAELAHNPLFVESREDHRDFGLIKYKSLDDLKNNFPPLHDTQSYTVEDAPNFAWAVAMDYLMRQFPNFLRKNMNYIQKHGYASLDSIWSLRIRGLYIFLKYYLHNQLPNDSDFFDFGQITYAPYCNVFVTERNASNVLRRIKGRNLMLQETDIFHVSDFIGLMEKRNFQAIAAVSNTN